MFCKKLNFFQMKIFNYKLELLRQTKKLNNHSSQDTNDNCFKLGPKLLQLPFCKSLAGRAFFPIPLVTLSISTLWKTGNVCPDAKPQQREERQRLRE